MQEFSELFFTLRYCINAKLLQKLYTRQTSLRRTYILTLHKLLIYLKKFVQHFSSLTIT